MTFNVIQYILVSKRDYEKYRICFYNIIDIHVQEYKCSTYCCYKIYHTSAETLKNLETINTKYNPVFSINSVCYISICMTYLHNHNNSYFYVYSVILLSRQHSFFDNV